MTVTKVTQNHLKGRLVISRGPEVLLGHTRQGLEEDVVTLEVKVHHLFICHCLQARMPTE